MCSLVYCMSKYNHHCEYTCCATVYLILTRYNRNDSCGKKSREAGRKITGSGVT